MECTNAGTTSGQGGNGEGAEIWARGVIDHFGCLWDLNFSRRLILFYFIFLYKVFVVGRGRAGYVLQGRRTLTSQQVDFTDELRMESA